MFCIKVLVKSERYLEKRIPYILTSSVFAISVIADFFYDFKALNEYFQSSFMLNCSLDARLYENKLQISFKVRISAIILEIRLQVIWCRFIS